MTLIMALAAFDIAITLAIARAMSINTLLDDPHDD